MQLLIDIHGYSYVPDAAVPEIQAAVARIAEVAAKAGYPLKTDCQATHPDTPDAVVPVVTGCEPTSAVCGAEDLTLHVYGTGFTPESRILFNGGEEPTTVVSTVELTTGVKPSLATVAVTVPVSVVGASTSADFTFTAAGTPSRATEKPA